MHVPSKISGGRPASSSSNTASDAAYLALAKRQRIGLATLDDQLSLAAQTEGVLLTI